MNRIAGDHSKDSKIVGMDVGNTPNEPPMSTQSPSFHRIPLLAVLPDDIRASLERTPEKKHFRRRDFVFDSGAKNDHVFLLLSGRVKLFCGAPSGREVTIEIVNPNEFFGEAHLFDSCAYGCTAEVMEDADVVIFRRGDLADAVCQSPESLRELAVMQSARRAEAEQRLMEYVFYDVPARLGHLLARLAANHGRNTKEGVLIRVKLTHQEIANLVGSTRETTTLILNDFRRRGLLEFSGRKIVVSDAEALGRMGGASFGERKARAGRA